jgi:hypothetical protein
MTDYKSLYEQERKLRVELEKRLAEEKDVRAQVEDEYDEFREKVVDAVAEEDDMGSFMGELLKFRKRRRVQADDE